MAKKYSIKYSGDGMPSTKVKATYDPLLQDMADDFKIDVEVVTCHGERKFIPNDQDLDKLYIFVQMVPDTCVITTGEVTNMQLGENNIKITGGQIDTIKLMDPRPKDMSIITDSKGQELAIVYDACLYFLNDFIHCHSASELETSIQTFKYVVNEATKLPALIDALKSGPEEKGKRALEVALKKQFVERLKKEKIQLESASAIIDNYTQELTKASRKIISSQSIIEAIQANIDNVPAALEKKWSSTKKLEGGSLFTSVSFNRTSVKATTTPIFIKEKKIWYQMGCFEITLEFEGNVRIMSTWPGRGPAQQHPHVNADGRPCWGNLSGELPKRIAESEFDVAFVEIHTFLCHYSQEGGPYANISNWPQATAEQLEMLKADGVKV